MSNTGHKNISRYKGKKKGTGLQVCVQWRKEIRRQNFSDSDFDNNPMQTLMAALEWRDEMETEMGKPRTERRILSSLGIYQSTDFYGNASWVAQCSPVPGKTMRKCFSIKKFGEHEACMLAHNERCRMEHKYYEGIFGV